MEIDFGTYHHTTQEDSREIRKWILEYFSKLLLSIYDADSNLEILDAGCGLGFLSSVAANCFPSSKITAVDTFSHESISDSTISKASENMRRMGIEKRVTFLEHDLREPLKNGKKYDLIISSLVFHNLGNERFKVYSHLFESLKDGGYFVDGDLFPHWKKDLRFFEEISNVVSVSEPIRAGKSLYNAIDWRKRWVYKVVALKKW